MSFEIMNLLWETPEIDLSGPEIAVFVRMASYARDDGSSVYPSLNRLASETRFSRATVIRSIRTIIKKGFMTKVREHSYKHKLANVYKINMDVIKSYEKQSEEGMIFMIKSDDISHSPEHLDNITETPPSITETPPSITETPPSITETPSIVSHGQPPVLIPMSLCWATSYTMTTLSINKLKERKKVYIREEPVDNFFDHEENCSHELAQKDQKLGIKKPKKEKSGCRLDPDVVLTDEWFDVLVKSGIHGSHADRIFKLFVGHWVSKPGKDALKVDWKMTWRTWCIRALGFDKMLKYSVQAQSVGGTSEELVMMGIDRHAQHKRYEQTGDPLDKPKILTFDDALERCSGGGS